MSRPLVHVVIGPEADWVDAFRDRAQAERFASATGGRLFADVDLQSRATGAELVEDYEGFAQRLREAGRS